MGFLKVVAFTNLLQKFSVSEGAFLIWSCLVWLICSFWYVGLLRIHLFFLFIHGDLVSSLPFSSFPLWRKGEYNVVSVL